MRRTAPARRQKKEKANWLRGYRRVSKATEYAIFERMLSVAGERDGKSEGIVEALDRLIWERNRALQILALDRLKELRP